MVGALLLWNRDNGSTLEHRNQMILFVFKCQNSLFDYFDTVNMLIDKMMEQSIATKILMNARKSYQTIQDIGQSKWCSNSPMLRIGQLTNGYQFWRKVEDRRKGFNIAWTRTILRKFLYLRAIERHSRSTINPALQDNNVLLPESFTEKIYHRRKRKRIEVNSESWFDSRSSQSQTSRQAVFFTVVHPMVNQDGLGETLCDLSQARIAPYKNTWKRFQKTVCWCILKLAQQRGLQFSQTRSNAVILHDTLPAEFIQKAICMKTKDQLYQKESVILRPRVVLKANSQSGSQDLLVQEARSSWESEQDVESCGETRSSTADCRVLGISISTVKLQDAQRQNNVTRNNEMFEKHQHKDHFLEDMSEKQEINKFSEESQQLLEDMNQTEIFELLQEICKTSLSWSTSGVRQQPRRLIATLLQSLALSLRRIPVENQSTAHLKDRSCSSRRRRCLRKRDNQSPAAIQRFSQGGFWGPSAFKRRIQCLAFCNRSVPVAEKSCLSRAMRS